VRKFIRHSVAIVVLLAAGGALALYFNVRAWVVAPIEQLSDAVVYEVPRGATLRGVLNALAERNIIERPRTLSLWLQYVRRNYSLKAGEYELQPGMSPLDIAELLHSGKVLLYKVTVVEGATAADFRRSVAAQPHVSITLNDVPGDVLMKMLGSPYPNPEGLFFPDTYRFPKGATDLELLRQSHARMLSELERAWSNRDPNLPLANAYEALILASIVEKETALSSERAQIAGVFVNRLRKGMRLQTDPTVIYGMGDAYDGNIRKVDLQRDTPYNTYTRRGLPPTPICLPGSDSIRAAVRPEHTDALFFVATGKGDGSHYFSSTLEEHNAAVQRYLKTLRRR